MAYETRDGDSGAAVERTALQIDRCQAIFIGGNDSQLLLDSLLELGVNNREEAIEMARMRNIV